MLLYKRKIFILLYIVAIQHLDATAGRGQCSPDQFRPALSLGSPRPSSRACMRQSASAARRTGGVSPRSAPQGSPGPPRRTSSTPPPTEPTEQAGRRRLSSGAPHGVPSSVVPLTLSRPPQRQFSQQRRITRDQGRTGDPRERRPGVRDWGRVDLREPSQPESESLVSEEEDEEDEEDESEEELLALRREGWLCCSAAGFSSAGNNTANNKLLTIKRDAWLVFFLPKQDHLKSCCSHQAL